MKRTSEQWLALMAPDVPWQECYDEVRGEAMDVLNGLKATDDISTTTLLDFIYPLDHVPAKQVKAAQAARNRMYRALLARPPGGFPMDGYCEQGPEITNRFGHKARRWTWHALQPEPVN